VSTISVDYDVLNQKGSPAWFSDTFANIPTAGYKGRMFISIDTYAFYRDTGTGWDLIGGPGTGTLTGSGTTGQVSFFNGTQTITGNNNLFWDNTNSRLGINTITPGAPLDIHGTGTQLQLNGTGANNSYLVFQNAGASKWRIGNLYNAGVNTFEIYNAATSSYALTIASATNNVVLQGSLTSVGNIETQSYLYINNALGTNQIYLPKSSGDVYGTIQTEAGGNKFSLGNVSNIGTLGTPNITWTSGMQVGINNSSPTYDFDVTGTGRFTGILRLGSTLSNGTYFYTLPSATGTLALTSALSSYLPLTGGTLTGQLYINPANTGITGLDVASNNTSIRSDSTNAFPRQLLITMGSGTLIQLTAKGYGANYGTDLAFYTATTSGVNASPGIYITGTNNRVGIKTGTPSYDLDISGTFGVSGVSTFTSRIDLNNGALNFGGTATAGSTDPAIYRVAGNDLAIALNSNERMRITNLGDVYIGSATTNKTSRLVVYGETTTSSSFALRCYSVGSDVLLGVRNDGAFYTGAGSNSPINSTTANLSNTFLDTTDSGRMYRSTASSIRFKDNIQDWNDSGLNTILALKPKTFTYKPDYYKNPDLVMLGLIAEEVANICPYLAEYENEDRTGQVENVRYSNIVVPLIKAIQELNEKLVRNNIN